MMDKNSASRNNFFRHTGNSLPILPFPFLSSHLSFLRHPLWRPATLLTFSTFFKDMFSLPAPNTVSSVNQQIELDEPAEIIGRVLHRLNIATLNDVAFTAPSLGMSYNEVKFHDKFNINTGRKSAEEVLRARIKKDPFATLAYASRKNDVALGRQAIKLIRFGPKISGEVSLWAKMSDVKPSWQLAFAKLTLPEFSYRYDGSSIHERDDAWSCVGISLETRGHMFDMEAVAAQFNPKWVHQIAKSTSADQQGLGVITRNCLGMWDQ